MFQPIIKSKQNEDISILVALDNHSSYYLCDCGEASDLTVRECQNISALFISHTHIDHWINFDFVLRHQIGTQKQITLIGPPNITAQLQAKIRGYSWNLIEPNSVTYEVREITEAGQLKKALLRPPLWDIEPLDTKDYDTVYSNKALDVYCTLLDHKLPTVAYLFKEKDTTKINMQQAEWNPGRWVGQLKTAYDAQLPDALIEVERQSLKAGDLFHLLEVKKGQTLGVIMDHAASAENHTKIKALFTECDQVFIESFYKEEDKELAVQNYHSYTKQSAKIMKDCRVKEAIPVHFSRKYSVEEVEELKAEFYSIFKNNS